MAPSEARGGKVSAICLEAPLVIVGRVVHGGPRRGMTVLKCCMEDQFAVILDANEV